MTGPVDYQEALKDPAACFGSPDEVVDAAGLTAEQKIEILKRWETDARLLMVAEEENMTEGEEAQLARVQEALRRLGADPHTLSVESGSKFR